MSGAMRNAVAWLHPTLMRMLWDYIVEGRWRFRCWCCHARNRSVSDWSDLYGHRVNGAAMWLCGECVYVCDGACSGVPYRKAHQ